jgi:DNA-binding NtrC family response regulator
LSQDKRILILDLHPPNGLCSTLEDIISTSSYLQAIRWTEPVDGIETLLERDEFSSTVQHHRPDLIGVILPPDNMSSINVFLKLLRERNANLPVIVVIEDCKPDEAISLLKRGATDFITPPIKSIDVIPRIWRLIQQNSNENPVMQILKEKMGLKQIVGESRIFMDEMNKIPLMARCDSTVLISGESGTGKELVTRAIHYLSSRARKPFLPVNCGAIPSELVENELFGHVRGAFTGAFASRPGLIHDADGGTLFLDEIDCLPLNAQVKFLRFLQDRVYRPLGSTKMQKADVRVVAASNLNLEEAVRGGTFRRDLFYRLNIIPVTLPSLRERKEDIPLLARYFLGRYSYELNKVIDSFAPEALQKLLIYEWPGNVRELENIIERVVVFASGPVIQESDIELPDRNVSSFMESFQQAKSKVIVDFEKNYLQNLLLAHKGNITRAAKAAKKNRRAFWELMRKHNIDVQKDIPESHPGL